MLSMCLGYRPLNVDLRLFIGAYHDVPRVMPSPLWALLCVFCHRTRKWQGHKQLCQPQSQLVTGPMDSNLVSVGLKRINTENSLGLRKNEGEWFWDLIDQLCLHFALWWLWRNSLVGLFPDKTEGQWTWNDLIQGFSETKTAQVITGSPIIFPKYILAWFLLIKSLC
jgi:hypothetical protein